MALDDFIDFVGREGLNINTYGDVMKLQCPVCRSRDIKNVWRIPFADIRPPIEVFGGYFNQIPILETPFQVYGFDLCRDCESIFLNPDIERKRLIESYRKSTHYFRKMEAGEQEWVGYEERYQDMLRYAPPGGETLLDAACGMGQIMFIARKKDPGRWKRMIGLELSDAYVANLKREAFEAYVFDLDRDDQRTIVQPGSIDFVSFFEAFEHVAAPLSALGKLLDLLRVGGRIYFSAQRYGKHVKLAIRTGEPIYVGEALLDRLPELLRCRLVDVKASGSRYYIVLERTTEEPIVLAPDIVVQAISRMEVEPPEPKIERVIALPGPYSHESGHCFIARLSKAENAEQLGMIADHSDAPYQSPVELLENDVSIGGPHAPHAKICSEGRGLYSHWRLELYFSTSDNSDPNINGRSYALRYLL